jgi:hypothetical protein
MNSAEFICMAERRSSRNSHRRLRQTINGNTVPRQQWRVRNRYAASFSIEPRMAQETAQWLRRFQHQITREVPEQLLSPAGDYFNEKQLDAGPCEPSAP